MSFISFDFKAPPHPLEAPHRNISIKYKDSAEPRLFSNNESAMECLALPRNSRKEITEIAITNTWIRLGRFGFFDRDREAYYKDNSGVNWRYALSTSKDYEAWHQTIYRYSGDNKCALSPLLTSSIIEEAETGPAETVFERALKKTDEIMKQRSIQNGSSGKLERKDSWDWS